jgi:membrane protein YqaA with SNARE-associated domain
MKAVALADTTFMLRKNLIAMLWGLAEATLFFILPDVLLTWIALDDDRLAWKACLWALVGALIGGSVMYGWGAYDAGTALAVLDYVPAVSQTMSDAVGEQIRTQGIVALFLGPISGIPYKIYAVQAGATQQNLLVFLCVSALARLMRFMSLTGLAILVRRLAWRLALSVCRVAHIVLWTIPYGWYFWRFWGS